MHKKIDVVRAWRDEEYRNSLTPEQLASLPESPAGFATVDDSTLRSAAGGLTAGIRCMGSTPDFSCVKPPAVCP
ncbi:MAG TPA: mersacidin/lichenicidin family type 2 lantibiotic [Thermoanaerobaculia bacterium]|jgi:mersacidin/lichenicidin family type 2 lantibiotic|nr:mersacidin/lichenicidin family type 2 lantibiotic [Thermoanaerobaculia bacterium]